MIITIRRCHQNHLQIASNSILGEDIGGPDIRQLDFRQEDLAWNQCLGCIRTKELNLWQGRKHLYRHGIRPLIRVGSRQADLVGDIRHKDQLELSTSSRETGRRSGWHIDGELGIGACTINAVLSDRAQGERIQQISSSARAIPLGQINADCGIGIRHAAGIRELGQWFRQAAGTAVKSLHLHCIRLTPGGNGSNVIAHRNVRQREAHRRCGHDFALFKQFRSQHFRTELAIAAFKIERSHCDLRRVVRDRRPPAVRSKYVELAGPSKVGPACIHAHSF